MKFYYSFHKDCHCEEAAKWLTRQSYVIRRTRAYSGVRFLKNSESPRAFTPRDDIDGEVCDYKLLSNRTVRAFFSLFTLQTSLFLYWLFWKPTRKPTVESRLPGVRLLRLAERRDELTLLQEPPRKTRFGPDADPEGSTTGLPVG